jgi:hypothetical protein
MSGKYKTHRRAGNRATAQHGAKLATKAAKADASLHNRHGGGALPTSHKGDKARVTLPPIWRQ